MPNEKGGKIMSNEKEHKIMTRTLPTILDELDNYIQRVEMMVKESRETTEEYHKAAETSGQKAEEAKIAGQEAVIAARKAAEAVVAQVKKDLVDEILGLEEDMSSLRSAINQAVSRANDAYALAQAMNTGIAEASKSYNQEIDKLNMKP